MVKQRTPTVDAAVTSECLRVIESAAESGRVCLNVYEDAQDWIVIEGDRKSLAFLGELLTTFAKGRGSGCLCLDSPETGIFHPSTRGNDGTLYAPSQGIIIGRKARGAKPMRGAKSGGRKRSGSV
jgi:hypothetical protein